MQNYWKTMPVPLYYFESSENDNRLYTNKGVWNRWYKDSILQGRGKNEKEKKDKCAPIMIQTLIDFSLTTEEITAITLYDIFFFFAGK